MADRAPERWKYVPEGDLSTVLMLAWDGHPSTSSIEAIRRIEKLVAAPSPPSLNGGAKEAVKYVTEFCETIEKSDDEQLTVLASWAAQEFRVLLSLIERQGREIAEFMKEGTKRIYSMAARNTELEAELAEARAATAAMTQIYADLDQSSRVKISDLQADRRPYAQKWRDNALEAAAQIVAKYYPDDLYCQKDIRALASRNPADGE